MYRKRYVNDVGYSEAYTNNEYAMWQIDGLIDDHPSLTKYMLRKKIKYPTFDPSLANEINISDAK